MTLTKEEKTALTLQSAEAKHRCRETYATICQLKSILSSYHKIYNRWAERHKKADRTLAIEEKLTKLPGPSERRSKKDEKLIVKLTKQQILSIADEIGVKLDFDEDEDYDDREEVNDED